MKNRKIYLALAVLSLTLVATAALFISSKDDAENKTSNAANRSMNADQGPAASSTTKGSYQDYSEESLARATGTKLLFFHAPWCPQCFALDESIKAADLPDNVTIFKVDYDTNQALRKKYGITIQTTVVKLDEEGGVDKKAIPYDSPSWETVSEELL